MGISFLLWELFEDPATTSLASTPTLMASSCALLEPPLLLYLLSSFWAPMRARDREVVLLVLPEVNGSLGDTVNLTCILQPVKSEIPRVMLVRWQRLEPWGDLSTVAEFDRDQGPNIMEPNRVQFISAGKDPDLLDASLTLTELHPDDDANYTCEVTTLLHGSGRASTWVRVFYAPQVSISLYDDTNQWGHRETSLSCDARGTPKPEGYNWSTTTGPLPPYAVPQGTRLLLQPSKESINITFICCVSNALGMAQVTMRVLLPGPVKEQSQSRSHCCLIIFIVVPVTVVLVFFFLYFQRSRKSRQHHPSVLMKEKRSLQPKDRSHHFLDLHAEGAR